MRKICVIFTGGTIGSVNRGAFLGTDAATGGSLLNLYQTKYGTDTAFDVCQPLNVLSENMQKADLVALADCVRERLHGDYDGIVVTHGTDTLSFTAPLFSLLFCDAPLPVVFVSALFPLEYARSNGLDNFAAAVGFIGEKLPGVYVAFRNAGDPCAKIHLASRLNDCAPASGDFSSFGGMPLGEMTNGTFRFFPLASNPSPADLRRPRPASGFDPARLCTDILTLKAHSLTDYSLFHFAENTPRAVVLELYHSGTVCTAGKGENAAAFLRYCREKGAQPVLAPVAGGGNLYESAMTLSDLAILAEDQSFNMARIKTMLALGMGLSVDAVLKKTFFFEKVSPLS